MIAVHRHNHWQAVVSLWSTARQQAAVRAAWPAPHSQNTELAHAAAYPAQAEPVGGGKLVASGRMWVATEAEFDQRAVRMHAEGAGLPAEAILKRYLPPVRFTWQARPLLCSMPHNRLCSVLEECANQQSEP